MLNAYAAALSGPQQALGVQPLVKRTPTPQISEQKAYFASSCELVEFLWMLYLSRHAWAWVLAQKVTRGVFSKSGFYLVQFKWVSFICLRG